MFFFKAYASALIRAGYRVLPIAKGRKQPIHKGWRELIYAESDIATYADCGVGIACGVGATPICAVDIDVYDKPLAEAFSDFVQRKYGFTCERVGLPPKTLLVYRAERTGIPKKTGKLFVDADGVLHKVEILGEGQQFVAYHQHPDTGQPYHWIDFFGGLKGTKSCDITVLTETQMEDILLQFEQFAERAGLKRVAPTVAVPKKETSEKETFFSRVNEAALQSIAAWAPALFVGLELREYHEGYRISSAELGRELQEDLSIVPEGIVDFGVADMGDERQGKRSPIDLVLEWAPKLFDDPLTAPQNAYEAAHWLCAQMQIDRTELGFEDRRPDTAKKRSALEDAKVQIADCNDSLELLATITPRITAEIGKDLAVRTELVGVIKARYKALTGITLAAADLKAAMAGTVAAPSRKKRLMTEFGNAERMLDKYHKGLMFVPEIGTWFLWTGTYWKRSIGVELEHLAKKTVTLLPNEASKIDSDDERAAFLKFCAVSQKANMVQNMVTLARSDPRVATPASSLDAQNFLFGTANGAVDLRTGAHIAPDPAHKITIITDTEYNPDAKAPLFEQTVSDVFFNDKDLIAFFQRLIGYALLAQPVEDVLAIPYGSGSNGKSTVFGAIRSVLGAHAKTASSSTFLSTGSSANNAGAPREDILRLRGSRFIYVGEPEEGSELRESFVKDLTGGEPLVARGIQGKVTVEFSPTWVAFMPTNHRPIVKGDDFAIWRRLLPIPFTRNFDLDETITKDPDRAEKLAQEKEGILVWCVQGALEYQKHGLKPPAVVQAAREEYKADMDLLGDWLRECCELRPDAIEATANLWQSWELYARPRGELRYIPSSKSLGRRLSARFQHVRTNKIRGFRGLIVTKIGDLA